MNHIIINHHYHHRAVPLLKSATLVEPTDSDIFEINPAGDFLRRNVRNVPDLITNVCMFSYVVVVVVARGGFLIFCSQFIHLIFDMLYSLCYTLSLKLPFQLLLCRWWDSTVSEMEIGQVVKGPVLVRTSREAT